MNIAKIVLGKTKASMITSDIDVLKEHLGENFYDYFYIDKSKVRITKGYSLVVYDMVNSVATTIYMHGAKPEYDKDVLSLSISEYRDTSFTDSNELPFFSSIQNREIDITIALEKYNTKLQIVGNVHDFVVNNNKVFYLIDNIQFTDVSYYS